LEKSVLPAGKKEGGGFKGKSPGRGELEYSSLEKGKRPLRRGEFAGGRNILKKRA